MAGRVTMVLGGEAHSSTRSVIEPVPCANGPALGAEAPCGPDASSVVPFLLAAKREPRERIHSFHRYFGKLVPAIPRMAIREFTRSGDRVLDPFCGSGTTLVEAALAGREGYGVDLNPLAVLVARAKTTGTAPGDLEDGLNLLLNQKTDRESVRDAESVPYCVNLHHWFREEVIRDLVRLKVGIGRLPVNGVREFFQACFSAVLRDVSNADPRHVFPGYSKRLRALDAAGERCLEVMGTFTRGAKRRIRHLAAFQARREGDMPTTVLEGSAGCLPGGIPPVDLVVTNPPYISSIRYLETLKLELHWLELAASRADYLGLDRRLMGTERLYRKDYWLWEACGLEEVDSLTRRLHAAGHRKMSRVVGRYFAQMGEFFAEMEKAIRPGGHMVMKISDSFVREAIIPTHELLPLLARACTPSFSLTEAFPDQIMSRSLLTKRNSYSKMISHDWILIWRRDEAGGADAR